MSHHGSSLVLVPLYPTPCSGFVIITGFQRPYRGKIFTRPGALRHRGNPFKGKVPICLVKFILGETDETPIFVK